MKYTALAGALIWALIFSDIRQCLAKGFHYFIPAILQLNFLLSAILILITFITINIIERKSEKKFEWSFVALLGLNLVITAQSTITTIPVLIPILSYILPAFIGIYILFFLIPDYRKRQLLSIPDHKNAALILYIIIFTVYCIGAYFVISTKGFKAGDEVHYMLQTQSLVNDGDLDLLNNLPNLEFHESSFANSHISPGSRSGEAHSHHPFGLSILMAPGYFIAGKWGANFLLIIVSSCLGVILFKILQCDIKNNQISFFTALIFSLFLPFSIYAIRTYPEFITAICYLLVFYILKYRDNKSNIAYILAGFILGSTYWLLTRRCVIPLAILNLSGMIFFIKTRDMKKAICFLAPQIILITTLILINNYRFAGNEIFESKLNSSLTGGGSSWTVIILVKKLITLELFTPTKMLGILFDKRYGVIWTNAFLVLLLPATVVMTIKDFRKNWEAYAIFWGVYILTCGTIVGAWPAGVCHQPRYVLAAMPFLAIPCAKLLVAKKEWYASGGIQIALMLSTISLIALFTNAFRFDTTYIAYTEYNIWMRHITDFLPWFKSAIFYHDEICISHIITIAISFCFLSYLCFAKHAPKTTKTSFFIIMLTIVTCIAFIYSR